MEGGDESRVGPIKSGDGGEENLGTVHLSQTQMLIQLGVTWPHPELFNAYPKEVQERINRGIESQLHHRQKLEAEDSAHFEKTAKRGQIMSFVLSLFTLAAFFSAPLFLGSSWQLVILGIFIVTILVGGKQVAQKLVKALVKRTASEGSGKDNGSES